MTKHFHVRTPLVPHSKFLNQPDSVTSEPLGRSLFPFDYLFSIGSFATQLPAHSTVYVFLAQCVIHERHGGLTRIYLGGEDIVQAELTGKDIPHDVYRLLLIFPARKTIENIYQPSQVIEASEG